MEPSMTAFTPELIAALVLFALVSSITPGPNNTMLMASGANFGFRATIPHLLGVSGGFFLLVLAAGLGLGGLFAAYPPLHDILAVVGGAYLLWLAWKIATSKGLGLGEGSARPQTFLQAAAFQWVNPKAWAMALGGVTAYAPREDYVVNVSWSRRSSRWSTCRAWRAGRALASACADSSTGPPSCGRSMWPWRCCWSCRSRPSRLS
jgi:threonine/homoserine/homoserine lactone efflux protein